METTYMTDTDTAALLAEIDEAMAAYAESIEIGLAMSRQLIEMADAIDGGMADAIAELQEWV